MLSSNQSYILPSLSFQRVVKRKSPAFKLLWELQTGQRRNWDETKEDLFDFFKEGKASPKDIDPDGWTWLEKLLCSPWVHGSRDQFSMLYMLARLGTQINTPRLLHEAASWMGEGPHMALIDDILSLGVDTSEIEAPLISKWPHPCSLNWWAADRTQDPFFIDWISKNLQICPGFTGLNPLLEAILIESTDEVKKMLQKFPIDNQDNLLGFSTLHLAVSRPQHLEILLEYGADVNARDHYGTTPLKYAAATGNSKVAVRLLKVGAKLLPEDIRWHRNWLKYAVYRRNWNIVIDILSYLYYSRNRPEDDLRYWQTTGIIFWLRDDSNISKDLDQFQQLLEWGTDPNFITDDDSDSSSQTLAQIVQNPEELKTLILHGFNKFNHQDSSDNHALLSLSDYRGGIPNPELLEILLNGGSTVSHQNYIRHTSLHLIV